MGKMLIEIQAVRAACFILFCGIANAIYIGNVAGIQTTDQRLASRGTSSYNAVFGGNGETADGWPSMGQWIPTFEEM
jgi:hypothetical protein